MSNAIVGTIYSQIINRIIEAARNDFEEAAVDGQVLTDLKEQWQQNLTRLNVAHCPWDPPPQQPQLSNPPTVPSSIKTESKPADTAAQKQSQSNGSSVQIKQESGTDSKGDTFAGSNGYGASGQGINPLASQRAEQLLAQQFGSAASAAIQSNNPQPSRPLSLPGQQQSQSRPPPAESSLEAAQLDGTHADAWSAHITIQRENIEETRQEADRMLKAAISQSSNEFRPLAKVARPRKILASSSTLRGPSQLDGIDDDDMDKKEDDEDEDAINSDLDDDDELDHQVEDDGDGPVGETILCVYDKVQRVKNKWKCTLKDGILTTGSREFVFHKANGEFEW